MTKTSTTIASAAAAGVLAVGVAGAATAAQGAPAASTNQSVTASNAVIAQSSKAAKASKARAMKRSLVSLPAGKKLPIRDFTVSSGFGNSTGPHAGREHAGIDLSARTGTPIYAATNGKVVLARSYYGYGNLVMIKAKGGGKTLYAHQSKILVKKGERVTAGEKIGKVGSTGHSTGPHLHFEVRTKNDRPTPPLRYLGIGPKTLMKIEKKLDRLR